MKYEYTSLPSGVVRGVIWVYLDVIWGYLGVYMIDYAAKGNHLRNRFWMGRGRQRIMFMMFKIITIFVMSIIKKPDKNGYNVINQT